MSGQPLTVCTVSFQSADYLRLNIDAAERLNLGSFLQWVVVDNSEDGGKDALPPHPALRLLPGEPPRYRGIAAASYHHAEGLMKAFAQTDTRYVLVLDPDFYIVRPDWVRDVLCHMQENHLAFFGAPWSPRWTQKYRYFPSVHAMFLDLEQIGRETVNFLPNCPELLIEAPDIGGLFTLKGLINRLINRSRQWRLFSFREVATGRDTGSRIFQRYSAGPLTSECVQPVFAAETDFVGPKLAGTGWGRRLGRWIPDRWNFIPQRPGYFTAEGFASKGYPDLRRLGWEEFMWQSAPFGFHLRGHSRLARGGKELEFLGELLETFIAQGGRPRSRVMAKN